MEGERLRCEPIEAAILRQHQGALSVYLYRDEVLIELPNRFVRYRQSPEVLPRARTASARRTVRARHLHAASAVTLRQPRTGSATASRSRRSGQATDWTMSPTPPRRRCWERASVTTAAGVPGTVSDPPAFRLWGLEAGGRPFRTAGNTDM
jgi:hypothetical protein